MSGVGAFGVLWAVSGVVLGLRWWREREADLHDVGTPTSDAPQRPRFGEPVADGSGRRRQAMRLAYAAGTLGTGAGFLLGQGVLLALGAALMNLGTMYRYLVVALDREGLDTPLLPRTPRLVMGDVLERPLA